MPKSNCDYWFAKISRNRERDKLNRVLLQTQGSEVYIAWECQIKSLQAIRELEAFLKSPEK